MSAPFSQHALSRWGRGARHRSSRAAARNGAHALRKLLHMAAIAQLGERLTEDLKVPGSIPGLGMLHAAQCCARLSKAPAPCAMLRALLAACPKPLGSGREASQLPCSCQARDKRVAQSSREAKRRHRSHLTPLPVPATPTPPNGTGSQTSRFTQTVARIPTHYKGG